jgi:CDP-glucose 4,6-dehydratase
MEMMTRQFDSVYRGRRVLVTGHTGFKGSWLTAWLTYLGAEVIGVSAYLPSDPCNFVALKLDEKIKHLECDIRELAKLKSIFESNQPDMVFHLAAQALVIRSYNDPKLTFDTNVNGTVNVLECIRTTGSVKTAVIITSDKCYQNVEWPWGYRENDRLGGDDPYSASKACAEIVSHAYMKSFFTDDFPRVATVRAGNVIGGGDWAADRIVPDTVRAFASQNMAIIRNPYATRPWQHVLEPLSGYLWLGANLYQSRQLHGESFNFGPDQKVNKSVKELLDTFQLFWAGGKWSHNKASSEKKESTLLKLSCDKALHFLDWHAVLSFTDTVSLTAEWYKAYYSSEKNMYDFTLQQIMYYISEAVKQKLPWVEEGRKS